MSRPAHFFSTSVALETVVTEEFLVCLPILLCKPVSFRYVGLETGEGGRRRETPPLLAGNLKD